MRDKTIAFFISSLSGGGAENVFVVVANEFAKRGFAVDFLIIRSKEENIGKLDERIRLINFRKKRLWNALPSLTYYLIKNKPKVLFGGMYDASLISLMAKLLSFSSVKVIPTIHNTIFEYLSAPRLKNRISKSMIQLLFPLAPTIICVSKGVAQNLERGMWWKAAIRVIYNPIDNIEIIRLSKVPLDTPLMPKTIVAVGRLVAQKNFELLIKAFNQVCKRVESKLVILGEGNLRGELEMLIEDLNLEKDVSLLGFKENPYPYIASAEMLVLSSHVEGFGNVLVEALVLGKKIVATDCPSGPAEILENGQWGLLVEVNNEKALADAIIKAFEQNTIPQEQLIQRGMMFSIENQFVHYLNEIEKWI